MDKPGNVQTARSCKSVIKYCSKGSRYISNFNVASYLEKKGKVTYGQLVQYDTVEAFRKGLISANSVRNYDYTHKLVKAKNRPKVEVEPFPLYPWQCELNQYLNRPPHKREIVFIVDRTGNQGKSWFSKYYCQNHEEKTQIILPGKKVDMAHATDEDKKIFFFDCPRSKQGEYIQYDFLEELKNGYFFSPKFDSRFKQLPTPQIVVMMNESPGMDKLSSDRYLTPFYFKRISCPRIPGSSINLPLPIYTRVSRPKIIIQRVSADDDSRFFHSSKSIIMSFPPTVM